MKTYRAPFVGTTDSLTNFCKSITDCHHSTPEYCNDGKFVVRNFNIRNGRMILDNISFTDGDTFKLRISRAVPEPGDLIITREAPMGEVCIIPNGVECCLGQRLVLIKPNPNLIDNRYLLYSLLSDFTQIQIGKSKGTGSIVSNLRIPLLEELKIPCRTMEDQIKIGHILGSVDAKIGINNQINALLESIAKTLYNYWFTQFDFPDENGKPYKSSGGRLIWNAELKRDIPEDWKASTLSEHCSITRGVTYNREDVTDLTDQQGTPILRATNISNSEIDLDDMVYIPKRIIGNDQFLKLFDILIVMSSGSKEHVGKNALFYFDDPVAYGAFCSKLSIKEQVRFYINAFLHSPYFVKYIRNSCLGTNINNLTNDHIAECKILLPDTRTLSAFEKIAEPIYRKIGANIRENKVLAELRDWLLPMLMNGQVKVG